jgi:N-acetylmuramoyl-L-alanine amidase
MRIPSVIRFFCAVLIPALLSATVPAAQKPFIPETVIDRVGYVPLYDIVKETGVEHSYNPSARRGKLFLREHQAVYLEECSVMIIDGRISRAKGPVIRKNHEIMIPSSLFEEIFQSFYSDKKLSTENSRYTWKDAPPEGTASAVKEPDNDAKPTGRPENRKPSSAAEKIGFIIIDAGHGGKDPGAVGKKKIYEKMITLAVAKKIAGYIKKKNPSIKIYLTRANDTFLELGTRTSFANRKLTNEVGGIFLSVHVNASIIPKMTGFETYFLSQNPTNDEARTTAALENNVVILENAGKQKSYDDVAQTEALMITTQIQKESSDLADKIQATLAKNVKDSPSRGVKTADFYVLRGSLMPAVLVEIGYITNDKEMSQLIKKEYQDKIAQSISEGVTGFLSSYNKK